MLKKKTEEQGISAKSFLPKSKALKFNVLMTMV
jgi:hypothetical protein